MERTDIKSIQTPSPSGQPVPLPHGPEIQVLFEQHRAKRLKDIRLAPGFLQPKKIFSLFFILLIWFVPQTIVQACYNDWFNICLPSTALLSPRLVRLPRDEAKTVILVFLFRQAYTSATGAVSRHPPWSVSCKLHMSFATDAIKWWHQIGEEMRTTYG